MRRLRKKRARRARAKTSRDDAVDSVIALEDSDAPVRKLKDLLLSYLLAANYPPWPGGDGLAVDDVLRMYSQASAQGIVPGPAKLRSQHPDLAEHLEQFFTRSSVTQKSES